jgi:threonine aldolase
MSAIVDLRSDTVTRPSPGMRKAMLEAELGDDVFGDDPTVNRLQARAAEIFGFEAALLFPSGTQSNLAALMSHCGRGDEVILGMEAHSYRYEAGGLSVLGSIQPQAIPNRADGTLDLAEVEAAIKPDDPHFARTRLLVLENTITGRVLPRTYLEDALKLAKRRGLQAHLDGARIFNAAVALKRPVEDFCRPVDTLTFCLSKGLGAPVGSLICGPADFIVQARRVRKMIGGGMRQAGVLAAAGVVALESMVDRLAEDHTHARRLAEGLAGLPGIRIDLATVETNIVRFQVATADRATELVNGCLARKIKVHHAGPTAIRCVTHKDVDSDDIARALDAFREITAAWR